MATYFSVNASRDGPLDSQQKRKDAPLIANLPGNIYRQFRRTGVVPNTARLLSISAVAALIVACGGGSSRGYDRTLSAPSTAGIALTRLFGTIAYDYTYTLNHIASASANGMNDGGTAITAFKCWNFAYPTVLMSGTTAMRPP
jgi:hypothetical protein